MKILAHRGYWTNEEEKNTLESFKRAFDCGYGIETDIRDLDGEIVISHNPADKSCPRFTQLLDIWSKYNEPPLLALNIKSDGLYLLLENIFSKYKLSKDNYFLFDSSVPEQYVYIKREYNIFTRSSEFEPNMAFLKESEGIWLDQFTESGHIEKEFPSLISTGKTITVVSPELHKRDNTVIWNLLKKYRDNENFVLCTDEPNKAKEFFNED